VKKINTIGGIATFIGFIIWALVFALVCYSLIAVSLAFPLWVTLSVLFYIIVVCGSAYIFFVRNIKDR